jgi:hypothetical protein
VPATTADFTKLLDTMVEDSIDYGHILWPNGKDFDGKPRYALFKIERVDGEITVKLGD